ncbi:MAG: hypothetical protein WC455_21580 [Dehalococcoidia bacterium]|jgi:hypothetical protein
MSDYLHLYAGQKNPQNVAENGMSLARSTRDGSLITANWKMGLAMQGRVFYAKVGALSTPVVGGGDGTVIDLDQPEFGISIPSGTTLIPIRFAVQATTPLLATDADEIDILAAVDVDTATAFDGTWANTLTPENFITTGGVTTACTVKSVCSADTTDPVLTLELDHVQVTGDVQSAASVLWTAPRLQYEPEVPPFIVGPASVFVYWGGTVAVNAFAQIVWAEIPTTLIS